MYRARFVNVADRRLGRHVNHDPRSRRFPISTFAPVVSVVHERHVPIFDQGSTGSCTGNAAVGCTATGRFFDSLIDPRFPFDEGGAVACYSRATAIDGYAGTYPPDDTGSDGLSVAKALKEAGEISGYEHAFSFAEGLQALMTRPVIVGINWYNDMYNTDGNGLVRPTGGVAGGHEVVWDSYDVATHVCGFTNSWGASWGASGRFFMLDDDFKDLLAQDGDVTAFVPTPQPAPTPQPVPPAGDPAGDTLWTLTRHWSDEHHVGVNAAAARAVKTWAKATGRS